MENLTAYPTLYKTARDLKSDAYYAVIARDAPIKEDAKHLLLKLPHGNVWHRIDTLAPCL